MNYEKAYKILVEIFAEQEEVEIETIVRRKEDKTNEKINKSKARIHITEYSI